MNNGIIMCECELTYRATWPLLVFTLTSYAWNSLTPIVTANEEKDQFTNYAN